MRPVSSEPARPLLKWAGGKRQLLPALSPHYPARFDRYIEPFFGSGAVFFDLYARGLLEGRQARLADVNADLVGCYRTVRDTPDAVIAALARLQRKHRAAGDGFYYEVRDQRFNPVRAVLHATPGEAAAAGYTPELAAMLIFLNRTGFNGLFRLNRDGAFNVPVGRYAAPRICVPSHVRAVAAAFGSPQVAIECAPFDEVLADAGAGDFVYCDPPYAPLSPTARFAHYTAGGFNSFDQRRLQQAIIAACRRGASVLVSNSSAPEIVDLYSSTAARRAGLDLKLVDARRAINSRATARGTVSEVLVTNVTPADAGLVVPGKLRMAKAGTRVARVARTA
jgi:DNA adenine methylase